MRLPSGTLPFVLAAVVLAAHLTMPAWTDRIVMVEPAKGTAIPTPLAEPLIPAPGATAAMGAQDDQAGPATTTTCPPVKGGPQPRKPARLAASTRSTATSAASSTGARPARPARQAAATTTRPARPATRAATRPASRSAKATRAARTRAAAARRAAAAKAARQAAARQAAIRAAIIKLIRRAIEKALAERRRRGWHS